MALKDFFTPRLMAANADWLAEAAGELRQQYPDLHPFVVEVYLLRSVARGMVRGFWAADDAGRLRLTRKGEWWARRRKRRP